MDDDSVFVSEDEERREDNGNKLSAHVAHRPRQHPFNSDNSFNSNRAAFKSVSVSSYVKKYPSNDLLKKSDCENLSIGGCNSLMSGITDNKQALRLIQVKFMSIMYALFLVVIGGVITITGTDNPINQIDHIFEIIITSVGVVWMAFFHWDIQKYKKWTIQYLRPTCQLKLDSVSMASNFDEVSNLSINTAVIFNTFNQPKDETDCADRQFFLSSYRFSHGKHSGNFYLKCGMIIFCMGSIIHQGVIIAKQIHFFLSGNMRCFFTIRLLFFLIRCVSCFYQLYIVFKYSNILINRYKTLARFALMHLVGTSICFWFSTIIEETTEDYVFKVESMNGTYNYSVIAEEAVFKYAVSHHMYCSEKAIVNTDSMEALPYLYPFSIEYNIILASVWYKIWTNIGKHDVSSDSHHIRKEVSENAYGVIEINYKSANSISADCHASNLGLFVGLFTLLITFSTMVIFFATMKQFEYKEIGVSIYSIQIGFLLSLSVGTIPFAYKKIRQLDIICAHHIKNSSTAMDDFLILIPLPFFIVFYLLSISAQIQIMTLNSFILIFIRVLGLIHISIQTPFIVDATRRCANTKRLRFTKPGRGLVMILILLNITLWILYTFERKSVDKYHNMQNYYGKFIWMVITHTTIPLMLFYYFHCSVCLTDIWKHGYEKDESI